MHPEAGRAFAAHQEQMPTAPGAYSIPVKIQGGAIKDPTLANYENPTFIHTGEKVLPKQNIHAAPLIDPKVHMEQSIKQDIQTFISQFDNAKDKTERSKILVDGKNRLAAESKALGDEVEAELKELLHAKEVALKLRNLIAHYETKMKTDQLSQLKLADEVTIKNLLKDKLHRELQGFRTSPSEFKDLEKVNPADISHIIDQIKLKVGQ